MAAIVIFALNPALGDGSESYLLARVLRQQREGRLAPQKFWEGLCKSVGRPELIEDPRFLTNPDRVRNRDVLVPIVKDLMVNRASFDRIVESGGYITAQVKRELLQTGLTDQEIDNGGLRIVTTIDKKAQADRKAGHLEFMNYLSVNPRTGEPYMILHEGNVKVIVRSVPRAIPHTTVATQPTPAAMPTGASMATMPFGNRRTPYPMRMFSVRAATAPASSASLPRSPPTPRAPSPRPSWRCWTT